jgi:hypothetical protein
MQKRRGKGRGVEEARSRGGENPGSPAMARALWRGLHGVEDFVQMRAKMA